MSIIDKVMGSVIPAETEQARRTARENAHAAATSDDWLSLVLQHHAQVESAFIGVKTSRDATACTEAQKELAVLLTGHANAEESVLYPALVRAGSKGHAATAYSEQAEAKTQMAALETLKPMSAEYLDKLEHIRCAVTHHMYEEESRWFLELKEKVSAPEQAELLHRYREEFARYMGDGRSNPLETASSRAMRGMHMSSATGPERL